MANLKVFGCSAWVHVPKEKRKKLTATAKELVFAGYSLEHKAYRFLDKSTRKVIVSRDVRFIESATEVPTEVGHKKKKSIVKPAPACSQEEIIVFDSVLNKNKPVAESVADEDEADEFSTAESESESDFDGFSDVDPVRGIEEANDQEDHEREPRRSERANKGIPPERFNEMTSVTKHSVKEPQTYEEAVQRPEKAVWQAAMEEEIGALAENQTWELVQLPPGRKAIGCKWTFKEKEDETGRVVRHKARLVAQGFTQRYGTDYDEVFAPVVKQTTLRTLLTIASRDGMMAKHLDIKCAYLYADLEEDIFMKQPPGSIGRQFSVPLEALPLRLETVGASLEYEN